MKNGIWGWFSVAAAVALTFPVGSAAEDGAFKEWLKKDREEQRRHAAGETVSATPDVSGNRQREIRQEAEELIGAIDEQLRGRGLSLKEFALAVFQQVLGDNPSENFLYVMTTLLKGDEYDPGCFVKVTRSDLIGLLVARKEKVDRLTYRIVERNLPLVRGLDLETKPRWQPPRSPDPGPPAMPVRKLGRLANRGSYDLYYGYLHAHTDYSDGCGKPGDAFRMARDEAKMDFFAVTDHAVDLPVWPWGLKWSKTRDAAKDFNEDGRFVALCGFEWSSSVFGHVNVIHTDFFTTCFNTPTMWTLYEWIKQRPDAICRFNHPGRGDPLGVEFEHLRYCAAALDQMVGIEMFNKSVGIEDFTSRSYGEYRNFLDEASAKGWYVGAVGGQDNHGRDWGLRNDFRVGVWATDLTRSGILDAYRARRTFATEDRNLEIRFEADDAMMGSRLGPGAKVLTVSLSDTDGEAFTTIDMYKSGSLLKSWTVQESGPEVSLNDESQSGDYYYVQVKQQDGDVAVSSPIWIVD